MTNMSGLVIHIKRNYQIYLKIHNHCNELSEFNQYFVLRLL